MSSLVSYSPTATAGKVALPRFSVRPSVSRLYCLLAHPLYAKRRRKWAGESGLIKCCSLFIYLFVCLFIYLSIFLRFLSDQLSEHLPDRSLPSLQRWYNYGCRWTIWSYFFDPSRDATVATEVHDRVRVGIPSRYWHRDRSNIFYIWIDSSMNIMDHTRNCDVRIRDESLSLLIGLSSASLPLQL